jgi:formylglycine-generating enzyme required for sulfatase activity
LEYFETGGSHYLAVANQYNGSSYNIDSVIYKFDGTQFLQIQAIPTTGAYDWESFKIGNIQYLVVANSRDGSNFDNLTSIIYQFDGSQFNEIQSIATNMATGWESFVIGSDTYLALSNYRTSASYFVDSSIYKWNGTQFTQIQTIATGGAIGFESFTIGLDIFLAVANNQADCALYKWDGTQFVTFQSISASSPTNVETFKVGSDTYLALADHGRIPSPGFGVNSKVYKFDGSQFEFYQNIYTEGAQDVAAFKIGNRQFLAFSYANNASGNTYNLNSKIFSVPFTVSFTNSIGMEFSKVPAGTFMMGSPVSEVGRHPAEGPQHSVTISEDFWMSKHEVTQLQWEFVMGQWPGSAPSVADGKGDNFPAYKISWDDLTKVGGFLDIINLGIGCDISGLPSDQNRYSPYNVPAQCYRLPTEAEWEYMARADTNTRFYYGEDVGYNQLDQYGNFCDQNCGLSWAHATANDGFAATAPVGSLLVNPWGLYDVHGNVFEWVYDWYDSNYYSGGSMTDPVGVASGLERSNRGGGWGNDPGGMRSAVRSNYLPTHRDRNIGVRLLRVINPSKLPAPSNIAALAGVGQVSLTWDAVSIANGYEVFYSTTTPVSSSDTKISTSGISLTIAGLNNGTVYYFAIRATNSVADGNLSNELEETPVSSNNNAQTLLDLDFNQDPSFSSTSPSNLYWDQTNGVYRVIVNDDGNGYWGQSTTFTKVSSQDFTFEVDIKTVSPSWGTYPAVWLVDSSVTNPYGSAIRNRFVRIQAHYDDSGRRFIINAPQIDGSSSSDVLDYSAGGNYRHLLDYDYDTRVLRWKVTDLASSSVLKDTTYGNVVFEPFNQLTTGFEDSPDYGSWAEMWLDNVSLTTKPRESYFVFEKLQSIQTNGAEGWESFVIGTDTYLAVANYRTDSSFSLNFQIYKWNNTSNSFEIFQTIAGNGCYDTEHFMIGSDHYLALANGYFTTDSKIYKWNTSTLQFDLIQSITTQTGHDWEHFTIGSDTYLFVSNGRAGHGQYTSPSKVFKWDGSQFIEHQVLAIYMANDSEVFTIGSDTYLAMALGYNGSTYNLNSKVLKWNTSTTQFDEIQDIATNTAKGTESFEIDGVSYLGFTNSYDGANYNLNSNIYRWNGTQFDLFQAIATEQSHDFESFKINGETYLAVANGYDGSTYINDSVIYKWDGTKFLETQRLETMRGNDWEAFEINGVKHLVVANAYNGSTNNNVDSWIYRATEQWDSGDGIKMVKISAGSFTMGSPDTETNREVDEGPQHQVTLTQDFYLGKYEVTQGQWQAVMGANPSRYSSCGQDCPVERVSWNEITGVGGFLDKLNQAKAGCDISNLPTDTTRYRPDKVPAGCYRLPTEAEWEYSARAGTTTRFSYGDDPSQIGNYGWYTSNSSSSTHKVGGKLPNPWGLYDMHGNVSEWNYDWYGSNYYSNGNQTDPSGPTSGSYRVVRGGSWYDVAGGLRSAFRSDFGPDGRCNGLGFRLLTVRGVGQ